MRKIFLCNGKPKKKSVLSLDSIKSIQFLIMSFTNISFILWQLTYQCALKKLSKSLYSCLLILILEINYTFNILFLFILRKVKIQSNAKQICTVYRKGTGNYQRDKSFEEIFVEWYDMIR